MITLLIASLTPALVQPAALPRLAAAAPRSSIQDPDTDPEYEKRLAEAGADVDKLFALHEWCREQDKRDLSKQTLLKIIELAPDHEAARKALGHRKYDDKWFESYSALSKYRREEEERMRAQGLVRFNDSWAPEADVPFLRMGWIKDPSGDHWVHPADLEQLKEQERMRSQGWIQQDLTWVSAEDQAKIDEGLWRCGDEWLAIEQANEYHSHLLQWWEHPGEHVVVLGTVPRNSIEWARWWADQSYPDLVRALGVQPTRKPEFLVFSSLQQYNTFAAGDQAQGIPASESNGSSSVHFAYFANLLFDPRVEPPMYRGMGVCFWEVENPDMLAWGQYAVRHAAAHSYMEAIDPSWETISQAIQNPGNLQEAAFWNEKRIPRWLRYGLASYCERYSKDPSAQEGGDPWGIRAWALQNLRAGGELEPFEQIFAMNLDSNDPPGSVRRIHSAGLLVSFMLDGDCQPVKDAHAAFKTALVEGQDTADAVQALQQALADNLDALKAYAKF